MTENETPEREAERLAAERDTLQRIQEAQTVAARDARINGGGQAQTQAERKISAITTAQIEGLPLVITVGTLSLIATPMTRGKQKEYVNLVWRKWPNLIRVAASIYDPKKAGLDLESLTRFINEDEAEAFQEEEQARAELCANLQNALTDRSTEEEKQGAVFVAATPPEPNTAEFIWQAWRQMDYVFLDSSMPAICDTVWILCEGTPGIAWPKTYTERLTGETDEHGNGIKERIADPPPKGKAWLDDHLDAHLRTPQYIDLLRAMNGANGDHVGDLASRFLSIA